MAVRAKKKGPRPSRGITGRRAARDRAGSRGRLTLGAPGAATRGPGGGALGGVRGFAGQAGLGLPGLASLIGFGLPGAANPPVTPGGFPFDIVPGSRAALSQGVTAQSPTVGGPPISPRSSMTLGLGGYQPGAGWQDMTAGRQQHLTQIFGGDVARAKEFVKSGGLQSPTWGMTS